MDGWIKLHRKIRENPIFSDMHLFRLWIICLSEATHKERDQLVGRQMVHLMPGEFVTGRFDLQGMHNRGLTVEQQKSPATVWRWLEVLEKGEYLSIKSSNKFSIVSILGWHKYQNDEQQIEQQVSNKRATSEQQVSTNKNVKKEKNVKKDLKEYTEDTVDLTNHLIELMKLNNPNIRIPDNLDRWNDEMDKLQRIDKYEYMQIRSVIDWCQQDSFWKGNILSVPKLREKIGTLIMQMQRKPATNGGGKVSAFERLQQMAREEQERETSGHH